MSDDARTSKPGDARDARDAADAKTDRCDDARDAADARTAGDDARDAADAKTDRCDDARDAADARTAGDAGDPSASWGNPRFAKEFPRHPELDALVAAFARGDYAAVREGAPKLAAATDDDAVARAARTLRERIEPDPASRTLFLVAAALLVFLTAWWVAHDGPDGNGAPAPPKVVVPNAN